MSRRVDCVSWTMDLSPQTKSQNHMLNQFVETSMGSTRVAEKNVQRGSEMQNHPLAIPHSHWSDLPNQRPSLMDELSMTLSRYMISSKLVATPITRHPILGASIHPGWPYMAMADDKIGCHTEFRPRDAPVSKISGAWMALNVYIKYYCDPSKGKRKDCFKALPRLKENV